MALFNRKKQASKEEDQASSGALVRRPARSIAKVAPSFTVGSLEAALLKEFPAQDAEKWDRTGVLVGEAALPVKRVAVALDPTVEAIREAARSKANVLVTHHPAFLAAPDAFAPESSVAASPGAGVWAAIQNRVALMSFHTALDVSPRAARVLPGMLGLTFSGRFAEPLAGDEKKGYGQICTVPGAEAKARAKAKDEAEPEAGTATGTGAGSMTLAQLAARCLAVFGRVPRVWGDPDRVVRQVVTATGSAGTVGRACLREGVECLVCGEVKYHEALDLSGAGLSLIELGHDVSELPLVAVLADALARIGVAEDDIVVIDQSGNWWTPEALRV